MIKYHIIPETGEPGKCEAELGGCPYKDVSDHYSSREEAREAFEASMGAVTHLRPTKNKTPDPEFFVSILTGDQDVLTENYAGEIGKDLEPGDYSAQFYDEKLKKDRFIRLTVASDGAVSYEQLSRFKRFDPKTSPRTLAAFGEADSAYRDINADPLYCAENGLDRVTLMEASKGFERILAKHDLSSATDALRARRELDDLDWILEHDEELAAQEDKQEALKAIREARKPLAKLLSSIPG